MLARLDHERLDVYRLLLRFVAWQADLEKELKKRSDVNTSEERGHMNRAAVSALLNTAEGNGKRRRQVRARFFDDARGSATESAACLDSLVAKNACPAERVGEGKEMLVRSVQMLTKLVNRFSTGGRVGEALAPYGTVESGVTTGNGGGFEIEDEDEDKIEDEIEIEDENDGEGEDECEERRGQP